MSSIDEDRPKHMHRRLVAGAAVVAVVLSGCERLPGGPGSAASSRAGAPSTSESTRSSPIRPTPAQQGPTYRVTATVPVGKYPGAVAVDPRTHAVYVADDLGVSVIDGSTHTVTATIPVQGSELAVDPSTHTVYVTQPGEYAVSVIDGLTHTLAATVPIGEKPEMIGNSPMREVAVDPGTHTVYVANSWRNAVTVIDGSTHEVAASVPVGAYTQELAVDPGTHTVYVTKDEGDITATGRRIDKTAAVIDGATRTVAATIPVRDSSGAVAVDPDTHTVYITNNRDSTVSVIDGTTLTVTATIPVGKRPTDVAVDSGTHTVYVVGEGRLSVIDGPTRTVTTSIPVNSASGHSVAVDPDTHTVYVTNTANKTVSVIERR